MNISNLEPQIVWKYFYELTQIPRPSKKEKKAADYVRDFGRSLGLETLVDEIGNVLIRKPATPGMDDCKGVILQSHLDMVPQKNSDKKHDFETDPIEAYIDGEWVTANGTTLGADNGMGVAASMAVLASKDIVHGPIEALFTIDEETGMTGANNLKVGFLKGDILMNLDSEDEGELYVGCAGGLDGTFTFDYNEEVLPAGYSVYKISVTGMKGGHSGMDIILGRGNANKTMIRFLKHTTALYGVRLSSIEGGSLRNAIPREAFAVVAVSEDKAEDFKKSVDSFLEIVKAELSATEPNLKITIESATANSVMDTATQNNLINAVYGCPNGVMRMSDAMPGLVETSTNLAIVKSENGKASVSCLMRSSVDTAKDDLANMMDSIFMLAGAKCEFTGGYPGWKPNMDSAILNTMKDVYEKLYGRTPEIKAIHAGLECGIIGGIYPGLDMISCGPTIRFPHSPDEKVKIDTVDKWWKFLVETLKNIPKK